MAPSAMGTGVLGTMTRAVVLGEGETLDDGTAAVPFPELPDTGHDPHLAGVVMDGRLVAL